MKLVLVAFAAAALSGCAILDDLGGGGEALSEAMVWRCEGGAGFRAQILSGERARIVAGGQTYTLPRTGPGARYASGGVSYAERGGGATLEGAAGGPYRNCRR
jgi:Membrane-bound lysozyme-inhibitor of c-type lysozyme